MLRQKLLFGVLSLVFTSSVAAQDCVTAKCATALNLPRAGIDVIANRAICAFNNVCTPIAPALKSLFTNEMLDLTLKGSELVDAAACTTHTLSDCSDTPSGLLVAPRFSVPPALGLSGTPRECQQTGLLNLQICGIAVSDIIPRQDPGATSFIKCVGNLPEIPANPCVPAPNRATAPTLKITDLSDLVVPTGLQIPNEQAGTLDQRRSSSPAIPDELPTPALAVPIPDLSDATQTPRIPVGDNTESISNTKQQDDTGKLPVSTLPELQDVTGKVPSPTSTINFPDQTDVPQIPELEKPDIEATGSIKVTEIPSLPTLPAVPNVTNKVSFPPLPAVSNGESETRTLPAFDLSDDPKVPNVPLPTDRDASFVLSTLEIPRFTSKLPLAVLPDLSNIEVTPTIKIPEATDNIPVRILPSNGEFSLELPKLDITDVTSKPPLSKLPEVPGLSTGELLPTVPTLELPKVTGELPIPALTGSSNEEVSPVVPTVKIPSLTGTFSLPALSAIPSVLPPELRTGDTPAINAPDSLEIPPALVTASLDVSLKPNPTGTQVSGSRIEELPGSGLTSQLPAPKPVSPDESEINTIASLEPAVPSPVCSPIPCLNLATFFEHYRFLGRKFPVCGNLNHCYNLPKDYEKTISSLKFGVATGCVLYDQKNCGGKGFQVPSLDLPNAEILEQFQDRAVSFQCYQGSPGAPVMNTCDSIVESISNNPILPTPDSVRSTGDMDIIFTREPRLPATDTEVDGFLSATVSGSREAPAIVPTPNLVSPTPGDASFEPISATIIGSDQIPTEDLEVMPTGLILDPFLSGELMATVKIPSNRVEPGLSGIDFLEATPSKELRISPSRIDSNDMETPTAKLVDELPEITGSPAKVPDITFIEDIPSVQSSFNQELPYTDIIDETNSQDTRFDPAPTDFPIEDPSLLDEIPNFTSDSSVGEALNPTLVVASPDLSTPTDSPIKELPDARLVLKSSDLKSASSPSIRPTQIFSNTVGEGVSPVLAPSLGLKRPGYSFTTSVVYVTRTHIITSCHPTKTKCKHGDVVTETVSVYTTTCPIPQIVVADPRNSEAWPALVSEERVPYDPTVTWPKFGYQPSSAKSGLGAQFSQSKETSLLVVGSSVPIDLPPSSPSILQDSIAALATNSLLIDPANQGFDIDLTSGVADDLGKEEDATNAGSVEHAISISILAAASFVGVLLVI